jgi:peptidoglycan/xylan/chitin deacetylase (PgdA/CDA1 family)
MSANSPRSRLGVLAVLVLTGCVSRQVMLPPAPPPAEAPAPPPVARPLPPPPAPPPAEALAPPPPPSEHVRVFPDFVAVIAQPGDTLASLATRFLNDPSLDWRIAEFNGISTLKPGQEVVVPLRPLDLGGVSSRGYQTVPVLAYHKFSKQMSDRMTVREDAFEEQMAFLKRNGYRVITLDDLFDFLDRKRPIPRKSVVITFDDGWRSMYEIAYPILKKYGYPATLFVYTDLIHPSNATLDWAKIREMARNGIDVQGHSKTHRNLGKMEDGESLQAYFATVKADLIESAKIIKRQLDKDVKYLAYPFGDTNSLVIAMLGKLGFRGAFTVVRSANSFFADNYRVSRSMIYGTFDLTRFQSNLGWISDDEMK